MNEAYSSNISHTTYCTPSRLYHSFELPLCSSPSKTPLTNTTVSILIPSLNACPTPSYTLSSTLHPPSFHHPFSTSVASFRKSKNGLEQAYGTSLSAPPEQTRICLFARREVRRGLSWDCWEEDRDEEVGEGIGELEKRMLRGSDFLRVVRREVGKEGELRKVAPGGEEEV